MSMNRDYSAYFAFFQKIHRRKTGKIIISVFFFFFLIWFLLQILAPIFLPSGSVTNLTGVVGSIDNTDHLDQMPSPWSTIYTIGDQLCHQHKERSFFINGNQMPFCSRCTAIWLGIVLGLGIMLFYCFELTERFIVLILLCLIPIGIDGFGQLFGFWESINLIRFMTGLLAGLICGVAFGVIFDEIQGLLTRKNKKDLK
ncbi:MAG: DUF2085 domain-containing protein [Candidatus Thermoplasmatota archaeon]